MAIASAKAADQARLAAMDADSVAFMAMQPPAPSVPPTPAMARENLRRARLVNQPDLPHVHAVKEYVAAGPVGPIPVRAYRGAGTRDADALPVLVYYHGGGWVVGDLDSHDWTCRMIANAVKCAVVSVDYRLAPEHPFPAAFDDALAATKWVAANAQSLRIDATRLSVGGDSAGGNLAAAAALALRDDNSIKLRAQILTYPIVDLTRRYDPRFDRGVALTGPGMDAYIAHYVPDATQRSDWRASPLFASSLQGLPPALVILAGFDPLYDEGEAYAARLKTEGVAVAVKRYPGQMHGFLSRARLLPRAYDGIADIAAALKANH
jgi:acetyl esterase